MVSRETEVSINAFSACAIIVLFNGSLGNPQTGPSWKRPAGAYFAQPWIIGSTAPG